MLLMLSEIKESYLKINNLFLKIIVVKFIQLSIKYIIIAGWSSPVARQAHNLKVVGSNPTPATNTQLKFSKIFKFCIFLKWI